MMPCGGPAPSAYSSPLRAVSRPSLSPEGRRCEFSRRLEGLHRLREPGPRLEAHDGWIDQHRNRFPALRLPHVHLPMPSCQVHPNSSYTPGLERASGRRACDVHEVFAFGTGCRDMCPSVPSVSPSHPSSAAFVSGSAAGGGVGGAWVGSGRLPTGL